LCWVQPSHKERAIGAVRLRRGGDVNATTVHHERNVGEEKQYLLVAQTSNNRVITACELYCCLLPQCEALRTCCSGFPIATAVVLSVASNAAKAIKNVCGFDYDHLILNVEWARSFNS